MVLELPIPTELLGIIWLGMGITFGRAFGKQLDQSITKSEWFTNLKDVRGGFIWQQLVSRTLDATHHWWFGGLLMLAYPVEQVFYVGAFPVSIFWFGLGLLLDDLPDLPPRIAKLLSYMGDNGNSNNSGQ